MIKLNVIYCILTCSVSGVQAATYSYIGEFHSDDTRTRALSFVSVFMPVCFIYLPLLAYFIIPMQWKILIHTFTDLQISPWRLYLLCSSLLNGINLICLYKLPESPKFLLSINRKQSAMIVLKQMYAVNTGKDREVCECVCEGGTENFQINEYKASMTVQSPNKIYIIDLSN